MEIKKGVPKRMSGGKGERKPTREWNQQRPHVVNEREREGVYDVKAKRGKERRGRGGKTSDLQERVGFGGGKEFTL